MSDLRPFSEIHDGIHWLKDAHVNIYIIEKDDDLILIDSGLNKKAKVIFKYIKTELEHRNISKILLTHYHTDHIGGLHHIHERQHPLIYSSSIDGPVIKGEKKMPLPHFPLKPLFYIIKPFTRRKPVTELQYVKEGEFIENIEVFDLPGHTMGSIGFKMGNIMFSGDNATSENNTHVGIAPMSFIENYSANLNSLKKLSNIKFDMLLSGHGPPILEDAQQRTLDAVDHFFNE